MTQRLTKRKSKQEKKEEEEEKDEKNSVTFEPSASLRKFDN